MIEEQYVSFDTAKMLKEAGFDVPTVRYYHKDGSMSAMSLDAQRHLSKIYKDIDTYPLPTQALAARWLREVHEIDVMIDVYNRDYYVCNVYKNKHLMIINNIVTSDFEEALEEGLKEAIKLIKK